jgi:hypothetical protein
VEQGGRPHRLSHGVAHAGALEIDQDRAGVDAVRRHHAGGAALEQPGTVFSQHVRGEPILGGVPFASYSLAPDAERRDQLDAGARDAKLLEQFQECDPRLRPGVGRVDGGDRERRFQSDRREVPDARAGGVEHAAPPDGVVLGGAEAVEGDAEIEAVRTLLRDLRQRGGDLRGDQHAIGQDTERPVREGEADHVEDVRVEEGLSAGEVPRATAQIGGFGDGGLDLRAGHHRMPIHLRPAGDEAVAAGDVTARAGDLQPERVEVQEGEGGDLAGGHAVGRITSRPGT